MYKIEFNEEMTIEGILESFKNLKEAELEAYIEIDGVKIYSNDDYLVEKIREAYEKHHTRDAKIEAKPPIKWEKVLTKEEKLKEARVRVAFAEAFDSSVLSNNRVFKFELGIVLEYTKDEYKEFVMDQGISYYGPSYGDKLPDYDRYLNYESSILLILASEISDVQKRLEIRKIIDSKCVNDTERMKFSFAIQDIIKYTVYGDSLNKLLYTNILDKTVEEKTRIYKKLQNEKQS